MNMISNRVASIDILRAVTMILMIFVNDLWSLTNIPGWLEHVESGVDGIGLADTIFPAFLFIVGLSIPFSIESRRAKGESTGQLLQHVFTRTIALLVMGVFLVNGEEINEVASGLNHHVYNTLCCVSFICIWNSYPKTGNKNWILVGKAVGILTLIVMAFIYRGGDDASHFSPKWWGILGLIGWAYGASGVVAILSRNKLTVQVLAWIFFCGLSVVSHAGLITHKGVFAFIPGAILGGTMVALTMGGVVTSTIFSYYKSRNESKKLIAAFVGLSILLIGLSIITRPYWGLSKLGATPAWLFLCSAYTILAWIVIYWISDLRHKENWFHWIKPAGTDTLLCYLIPYFSYALVSLSGIRWPEIMLTGATGLTKSFLFALLCVAIVNQLNKIGIKLKL